MVFPLAALGAGIGQFAQDYRQQQALNERSMMLAMQLAHYKQALEKDRRDAEASGLALNFGLPSGGTSAGQPMQPSIGGSSMGVSPGMPRATSAPPQDFGASGEYGAGQGIGGLRQLLQAASGSLPAGYRAVETSGSRPGARVAGTGGVSQHALDNALDIQIIGPNGPIPNTGEDTTGLYGQLAMAMRKAAPPELVSRLGWGGNFTTGPSNGPRDLMHFDLAGDRGRYGTLAQMAQASPGQASPAPAQATPPPAAAPPPPPPPRDIALLLRKQNPNADTRSIISAATEVSKRLQEDYKNNFERWKATTGFAGEAAGRAETGRHNVVSEGQAGQRLGIEGAAQQSTATHQRATEADLVRQRELQARGLTETERSARAREQNTATSLRARLAKEQGKTDTALYELESLIKEARTLAEMVDVEPTLVGAPGMARRAGGIASDVLGAVTGTNDPLKMENPASTDFKSKLQILQSRLMKPLLDARYFSGPAQKQINELLPGLTTTSSPIAVKQSLTNIADKLEGTLAATKAATSAATQDYSKATDEELLKIIGVGDK